MSPQESHLCHLLKARSVPRLSLFSLIASLSLVLVSTAANAQTVPSRVGNLLLENSTINADPTLTALEAQGLGVKFELLFAMANAQDPQNSDNDVIGVNTAPFGGNVIGVAVRNMLPGAKIDSLTNQISLKYFFVPPRDCGGGSPRIQLFINPGDGTPPHNAFGYVGNAPFGTACMSDGNWHFQDMTDNVGRWDLSKFGGPMTDTWAQVILFFDTRFPNHTVLSGGVFDDSASFSLLATGQAFYDLLTVENRTLENKQDTVQGPTQ